MPQPETEQEGWNRLLRHRLFLQLWLARTISQFGSTLGSVALLWYVFFETGSAISLTFVGLAEVVPALSVGLLAGAMVDRLDRRRTSGLSTLGRSLAMACLILSIVLVGFHLNLLLLVVVVFSLLSTFMGPATTALLPEIVGRSELSEANGLIQASSNVVTIVGASLAGVVLAIAGVEAAFAFDAGSFAVGGLLALTIPRTGRRVPAANGTSRTAPPTLLQDVVEGARYLRTQSGLLQLTLAALVLNFFSTLLGLFIVVYATDVLRSGALVFGAINAALAAGGAAGGLAVGPRRLTRFTGRFWAYGGLVYGSLTLGLVLFPFLGLNSSTTLALVLVDDVGFGLYSGILGTTWLSTAQAMVKEEFQGRYFSLDNLGSFAATPAAQVVGGVLTAVRGVVVTYAVSAVGASIFGGFCATWRDLKRLAFDPRTARKVFEGARPVEDIPPRELGPLQPP